MEYKEALYSGNNGYESQPENYSGREYYSVGIDTGMGLKEKIEHVHGTDSQQVSLIGELEHFLNDPKNYQQATNKFRGYVKNKAKAYNNSDELVDELVNAGYIKTLQQLSYPNSGKELDYFKDYAETHDITLPQAVLFGPNGSARKALKEYQRDEMLRGQHRKTTKPANLEMAKMYDQATGNTQSLPKVIDQHGNYETIDISEDKGKLPLGIEGLIGQVFGREKALRRQSTYKGAQRLKGDLSYQVLEAMTVEVLAKQTGYQANISSSDLEQIIEKANMSGKDVFTELYYSIDDNTLKSAWNEARKKLNDYALNLWKERNGFDEECIKYVEKELPGTVHLNGTRYYWRPKRGEVKYSLVPEKEKNKLPGCLSKRKTSGYAWVMPHIKFQRKLVSKGQKFATKDLKTARRLQKKEWKKIQREEPQLAEKIRSVRWGKATKHKPTAVKIAKNIWRQIQEDDPEMAARIMSDRRSDISKPDIDKVWPNWKEQKQRLKLLNNKPQLPIVYPKQSLHSEWSYGLRVPEKLDTMVNKMKRVDWIRENTMLVFDDSSPFPVMDIAAQSMGQKWADEQSLENNKCVIQGCSSIDKDNGRFKFTVYDPGYSSPKTLAEEIYHVVFGIMKETEPETFEAIERWHEKIIKNGGDPTLNISEAFSQAMAEEELGARSLLPRGVVKQAKRLFSKKSRVPSEVIATVKRNW